MLSCDWPSQKHVGAETGWDAYSYGCIEGSWECHRRQWAWWGLKWSWHGLITIRQILEVKYITRALEAHTHTWLQSSMLKNSSSSSEGPMYHSSSAAWQKHRSCLQHLQDVMLKKQQKMLRTIDSQRVLAMMTEFDEKKERQSPLFKFVRSYMRMVLLRCKPSVMVYGSCNSCLWMLCASSSSLVTSRSMPGWLLSTSQRWLLFRSQIQTYIKNSWVDPILCHRGGSCSRVHQPQSW